MTGEDVVREIQETYSEWLEMSQDPQQFIVGVLANKIIKLQDHVDYLKRRIDHDCARSAN
jgi:hypothetical protein